MSLVVGVDPGIIHPLALAVGETALLISGRALRSEEFLHLQDSKARARISSIKRAARRTGPGRPDWPARSLSPLGPARLL
jgi:hypothetical protein